MSRQITPRLLTFGLLLLVCSSAVAQNDPVERLTEEVLQQFMPEIGIQNAARRHSPRLPASAPLVSSAQPEQEATSTHRRPAMSVSSWTAVGDLPERDSTVSRDADAAPKRSTSWLGGWFSRPQFQANRQAARASARSFSMNSALQPQPGFTADIQPSDRTASGYLATPRLRSPRESRTDFQRPANGSYAAKAELPRPLTFSQASSNGIHAIQAVVPTDAGPQKIELRGNGPQIRRQVENLTPEARRIIARTLGL